MCARPSATWTSSFTVLSAGFALLALGASTWVLEVEGWLGAWTTPLLVFGMNPIAGFVGDALFYVKSNSAVSRHPFG